MTQSADQSINVVVVGEGAVGKTLLLQAYTGNATNEEYIPTTDGKARYAATLIVNHRSVVVELWDAPDGVAVDHRWRLYLEADAIFICYAISSPNSFEKAMTKWHLEVQQHAPAVPIILVGLKTDLRNKPEIVDGLAARDMAPISYEGGLEAAREIEAFQFLDVSARERAYVKFSVDEALGNILAGRARG